MKVIGFLNSGSSSPFAEFGEVFRQGLRDTGNVEDESVQIVHSWAAGNYQMLESLAVDFVNRGVDVIAATGGIVSAQAATRATANTPIVFLGGFNPDEVEFGTDGKVGPPPNATGFSTSTTASLPERLARLRQVFPGATKVGALLRPDTFVFEREMVQAAKAQLTVFKASDEKGLETAFASAKENVDALVVCADPSFTNERRTIIELARHHQLPAIYSFRAFPQDGGLMSYGPSLRKAYRHVGEYVGKVLNGTGIGELPVVAIPISDFEFVINRSATEGQGLELTPERSRGAQIIG